jgi:hypothetical protein
MRHTRILLFFSILLGLSGYVYAQPWSGILSPSRAVNWSTVGSSALASSSTWTQCGSTIPAGSSAATINAAIAACGANHYVQLGAGTFNLTSGIEFGDQGIGPYRNVKLVGMGADQTFLIFTGGTSCWGFSGNICMSSGDLNYVLGPSNLSNWTAGYSQGTTSITLAAPTTGSISNLRVGQALILDQLDDTIDGGGIYVCYATSNCSANGDNGGFARANRGQQQIVTVTSISGSGPYTIGVSPGLYMPNWNACNNGGACTPQAWWASYPIYNDGVESLSIDNSGDTSGYGINIVNCSGCWVKGVRSIHPQRSHVAFQLSTNGTVQDSYIYLGNTGTSSYGLETQGASAILFQNNILQTLSEPVSLNGSCSGCVSAYNFDINGVTGNDPWRMASILPHAVMSHMLMEGNQGSGLEGDAIHGTHHFLTAFRNNWNGYQKADGVYPTSNIGAVVLESYNRFFNFIGNVLGTTTNSIYAGYGTGTDTIYAALGASETGNCCTTPNDPITASTLMRWGNYDVVTGAVRWCGNSSNPGWSTTCASTSEVPNAITNYANPVPSSTNLPASFYLSSKPSWWPSGKAWPPIGPDVTGGNISGLGGYAYTIPAADCYSNVMNGPSDGTGTVLSFNAAKCYIQQAISPVGAPTNLTLVVH